MQIMEAARTVVIVPGYGMAVAQAQHRVCELFDEVTKRGVDVKFAIHPVAGRMPGHMNVLLAEAQFPYDRLVEMEEINPEMPEVDVVLVVGAERRRRIRRRDTIGRARSSACRLSTPTAPRRFSC